MKWIGQHIWDFYSRFRNDVYLESLTTTTDTSVLVVDSNNKPNDVDYIIPGNDDSIRALTLYCQSFAGAILEGKASVIKELVENKEVAKAVSKKPVVKKEATDGASKEG